MSRGFTVLLLALGCASGGGTSDPVRAPGSQGPVSLRFDWPPGLVAQVDYQRSRVVSRADRDPSEESRRLAYRMRCEAVPEGRAVRFDDFRVEHALTGRMLAVDELPAADAARFRALFPGYVVSEAGEFLRLEDLERMKEQLDRTLEGRLGSRLADDPRARRMIEALLSRERLEAQARDQWNQLVGAFAGADLQVGVDYAAYDEAVVPLFGGVPIPMQVRFRVERWLPCDGVSMLPPCVEIRLLSEPDPEAFRALVEQLVSELSPDDEARVHFESFDLRQSLVLVTEPGGMLPHLLVHRKQVQGTSPGAAGEQVEERVYRFVYESGP